MPENQETAVEPANTNGTEANAAPAVVITQAAPIDPFFADDDFAEDLLDDGTDDDDADAPTELFFPDLGAAADDDVEPEDDEELEGDDDEDLFVEDDDVLDAVEPAPVLAPAAAVDPAQEARLAKLEAAARQLAAAEMVREDRKVKRKVTAATTGAGAAGFIPLLLQLVDAYNLSPTQTATLSTVASLIGAFVAGWI